MAHPHVLFFLCDQMQYQRQGRIDPHASTPNLDRLSEEGTSFSHFYAANGQCVPSRASLQTGLYPHEAGVMIIYGFHGHSAHLTGKQLTIGQVFRDAGYTTAYFGKQHFGISLKELGYDHGADREKMKPPFGRSDRLTVDDALQFLEQHDPAQPLFLTVSLNMPHPPFEVIEEFRHLYPPEQLPIPESFYHDDLSTKPSFIQEHAQDKEHGQHDEGALRHELQQYYTMISGVDRLLGEVRAKMEEKGMWEHTVAAFTSDHGDMMGAHHMRLKGTIPYEEIFRIPLTIRVPEETFPRKVVDDLAVNISLPGTLIEAAGLDVPPEFQGKTLLPTMRQLAAPENEVIFYEHYGAYWGVHPFRVARTRDWKYIKYYGPDQTEELYHLADDPYELHNLAGNPEADTIRLELETKVDTWWQQTDGKDFAYYESPEFKASGLPKVPTP
ncbi:MAG TPA: sulfatase-like hydrolase/transferase [Ktedonobacteraceae bacterium]|jgi:arylsulfatase|nr:sulfatase-like hydrolase/transferase [Ktedonobacteraceae bacterium]